jgi:hypothetical protein
MTMLSLLLVGCGAEFDPPSELKTLRVLAVQKSAPYAKPGEQVEMRMLWHDGSPKAPRSVQIGWFAGCYNPPGDLYQGCFQQFAEGGVSGSTGLPAGIELGSGDRFSFTIPADIISSRPPPPDPKTAPYGLAYVFFAACGGQLGPAPEGASFPVACFASDGTQLGPSDFVAGYSTLYVFDKYRNENAIVTGFRVQGQDTTSSCIGDACLDSPPDENLDCNSVPCVAACNDDGGDNCPDIDIQPLVDPASAEIDQISVDSYGKTYEEQMWINYYVSAGGVASALRLLNDATKGWNSAYGTKFHAPKDPGPVTIWAVVHDNRGGVNWARQQVLVQ